MRKYYPAKVTKTGEGELLITKREIKGGHINIIVDEDGDIELMRISHNQKKVEHKTNATIDETINFWNNNIL